jgi:hypothetical protein
LALDADAADVTSVESGARLRGVPLKVIRDSAAKGREAYAARLILVRPDQYVVWSADTAPDDAAALFARVAGQD